MMRVYHGSLETVKNPEVRTPSHTLDYGKGFHTTTSYEQADRFVRRKMMQAQAEEGYVNVFELDETALQGMKVLFFDKANEAWLDFVMKNRTEPLYDHDYDVVYGPVADDKVYAAFSLYESGVLNKESLIAELRTYKLVDQYLLHTERALGLLAFKEAIKI